MKIRHGGSHESTLSEINIIPLVDIMLVLLIIFMVTAPLLQQGIDIALPEVNASPVNASKEDFILSIDADGRIFLAGDDKTPYSLQTLEEKLKAIFEVKEKKELFLRADQGVRYGYVVEVMALCQKAGVERVGMITAPEEEEKKK